MAAELTLTDVARSLSVSPATLRRWVAEGIVPLRDGAWTPAALAQARIVARMRHRGHDLDQLRRAAKEGRLAYGYLEDLFPAPEAEYGLADAARETGLEPELIRRIWSAVGFSEASLEHLSDDDIALLRRLARGARRRAAARRLPAARARVRAGARADGRRRGQALPPLRPRADDPRRRAGARHRGGAERPRVRAAAAGRPDHGLDPPAAAAALPRAGRRRAPRARGRRRRARPRARRDRLRRPRRLHAADRGGGGGGGARGRRALRRARRRDAARRRARDQDDRRRGDGRRHRRRRARRLGRRASIERRHRAPAAADRRPHRQRRSIATATTTGARSTSPRAWARGRPAARCWSRARSREAAGRRLSFQPIGEVKLKGFEEATELFLATR